MTVAFPFRVVVWERIDDAVESAVLTAGGKARRAIQSMIDLAVQGGGGGGLSGAAKTELVAVRHRSAADEAAPTADNWGPRPSGYGAVLAIGARPAPADARAEDLHLLQPAAAPSTATTTFTVADGAAWPTPWVVERVPAGGGATVVSGMGRVTSGSAGGSATADTAAVRYGVAAVDSDVLLTWRPITADPVAAYVARSDAASLAPQAGVIVEVTATALRLVEYTAGTPAVLASAPITAGTGVDYRLRVTVSEQTASARVWPAADPEPVDWGVTSAIQATQGYQGLTVGSGATAAAQTVAFDDITITSNAGGYGAAYGVAYGG